MTPELVIFDCDGVLVDSEPIAADVLQETIRAAGGEIDERFIYERLLGTSLASTIRILDNECGLHLNSSHLDAMRRRLYERFANELEAVPGIASALGDLPGARCVASSSQAERIRTSLGATDLLEFFDPNVFSATMVPHGKPAPDLFLHAAKSMGAMPDGCVVVEDSGVGIRAAKAAGMRVISFIGGAHAGPARLRERNASLKPDATLEEMRVLPDVVSSLA